MERVKLLIESINVQLDVSKARLESVPAGEGARFFDIFRGLLEEAEEDFNAELENLRQLPPDEVEPIGLRTILHSLRDQDVMVATYAVSVGRTDLALGLRMMVDRTVHHIAKRDVRVLIHVSDAASHSTSTISTTDAMILQLPRVRTDDGLLSPVIAHEITHHALQSVYKEQWDALQLPKDRLAAARASVDLTAADDKKVSDTLSLWLEEFACDAVAVLVAGPSFLPALIATTVGIALTGKHPPAELRIAAALSLLDDLGWGPFLDRHLGEVTDWAREFCTRRLKATKPVHNFLFDGARLGAVHAQELVRSLGIAPLTPSASSDRVETMVKHFSNDILPADMEWSESIEWEIVLAAWISALASEGGSRTAIPRLVARSQFGALAIKTIELVGIKRTWDGHDAAE